MTVNFVSVTVASPGTPVQVLVGENIGAVMIEFQPGAAGTTYVKDASANVLKPLASTDQPWRTPTCDGNVHHPADYWIDSSNGQAITVVYWTM